MIPEALEITTMIHDAHETVRFLWKDRFEENIAPVISDLETIAKAKSKNPMETLVDCVLDTKPNANVLLVLLAATEEIYRRRAK